MTTIGFIGLGNMGTAMAARLLEDGFDVGVWNRTASAADPLVEAGATLLGSPAEAFAKDITISMLANDQAVSAVISDEVLAGASGALHLNMATISVELARELTARHEAAGVRYLAAPVIGLPSAARAGQLNVLAAGDDATIEVAMPVLDALGKNVWRIGDRPAAASLMKIAVNYNMLHALLAIGESVNMVERGGIEGQLLIDVLTDSAFSGNIYSGYGKVISERNYFPAAFEATLGLKDLSLAQGAAEELGAALPTAPVLRELYETVVADEELKRGEWAIIAEVIRNR